MSGPTAGNSYSENYFHDFEVYAANVKLWRNQLFGQSGSTLYPVATDTNGNLIVTGLLSTTFSGTVTVTGLLSTYVQNGNINVSNFPAIQTVQPSTTAYTMSSTSGWQGLPTQVTRASDGKTLTFTVSGSGTGNILTISDWT